MKNPDSPFSQSITSHSPDPTIIKKSDYYTYHSRPCLSCFKKGMVSKQEGHVLKYRRACSQMQKGPFFGLNTHALYSCGAKQIYIKIKYSSPPHAFHSPHPFPFHPHSTLFPSPAHSPSVPSPLTFCPHPTSLLSAAHSLSVPNPLPVRPQPTPPSPLLPELVHLLPCLLIQPTCSLVSPSTRQLTMLLTELVHLLPCLLIHLTCSLVHSLIRLLVNYFYHLTFLSVLV